MEALVLRPSKNEEVLFLARTEKEILDWLAFIRLPWLLGLEAGVAVTIRSALLFPPDESGSNCNFIIGYDRPGQELPGEATFWLGKEERPEDAAFPEF